MEYGAVLNGEEFLAIFIWLLIFFIIVHYFQLLFTYVCVFFLLFFVKTKLLLPKHYQCAVFPNVLEEKN